MRVTAQSHRPADACNVLAVGWLTETKESRPGTWQAMDLRGRPVRCSEPLPEPCTTHCTEGTSENKSTEACYTFLRASGPMNNCVAFSWAFWKQNCSTFYTYRERKWGKQQRVSGPKRNRRSPLPNSPHSRVPLSMKNGAKLPICKALMKNKKPPNPIRWLGHLSGSHHQMRTCISFRGRVCGSPSSSCSPGGTGHWGPLLVMP